MSFDPSVPLTIENLDYKEILRNIDSFSLEKQAEILPIIAQLQAIEKREECQKHFLSFVRTIWPEFIDGAHFHLIGETFEKLVAGDEKRVTMSIAPRHGKSKMASVMLPAWFLGKYPDKKIIIASHTAELAVGFGREVRNLVSSQDYQKIFPGVSVRADSKAAGRWSTNKGGELFAIGVHGAASGRGADLLIIDDPVDEQTAQVGALQPEIYDKIYDWYSSGPRQRLQPNARAAIIMTRWHKRDLIGQVLSNSIEREGVDAWNVIEFPAVLPPQPESGLPERALWPQYWSLEELLKLKAELPPGKWNAQYMQAPSAEESTILKRAWWKRWRSSEPPLVKLIIMTCDTAYSAKTTADFSASTVFGVFDSEDEKTGKSHDAIILLDAWAERLEFPDLKARLRKEIEHWKPDSCIIEAKAAGSPLLQELRASGIYVTDYTPVRGSRSAPNDKIARANAVSDILRSGLVWAPDKKYADDVIEQCSEFPFGRNDDLMDCVVMALQRFRQGGFIRLANDDDDDEYRPPLSAKPYY